MLLAVLYAHELHEKALIKPSFHGVLVLFQSVTYFQFVSKSK
jgi:hypothetical protein